MSLLLFSFGSMYQCHNRAITLRKCSIKAPAKCKTSFYVLVEIYLHWSKWLGPLFSYLNINTNRHIFTRLWFTIWFIEATTIFQIIWIFLQVALMVFNLVFISIWIRKLINDYKSYDFLKAQIKKKSGFVKIVWT